MYDKASFYVPTEDLIFFLNSTVDAVVKKHSGELFIVSKNY